MKTWTQGPFNIAILSEYLRKYLCLWELYSFLLSCSLTGEFQRSKRRHFFKSVVPHQSQAEWVLTTFPKVGQNILMTLKKKRVYIRTHCCSVLKKIVAVFLGCGIGSKHTHTYTQACTHVHTCMHIPTRVHARTYSCTNMCAHEYTQPEHSLHVVSWPQWRGDVGGGCLWYQ